MATDPNNNNASCIIPVDFSNKISPLITVVCNNSFVVKNPNDNDSLVFFKKDSSFFIKLKDDSVALGECTKNYDSGEYLYDGLLRTHIYFSPSITLYDDNDEIENQYSEVKLETTDKIILADRSYELINSNETTIMTLTKSQINDLLNAPFVNLNIDINDIIVFNNYYANLNNPLPVGEGEVVIE